LRLDEVANVAPDAKKVLIQRLAISEHEIKAIQFVVVDRDQLLFQALSSLTILWDDRCGCRTGR
jgi:hypothetical protein